MRVHTMLFVHEHGHAIGSYPVMDLDDDEKFMTRMAERFELANRNPSCIASFWWHDAGMVKFQFNRA